MGKTDLQLQSILQHLRAGRTAEAEAGLRKALLKSPVHPEALYRLGTLYAETGRRELAVKTLNKLLAVNPRFAPAHNSLGIAMRVEKNLAEAVRHYAMAVQLDPQYAEAQFNLGVVLWELGRLSESAEHLSRAASLKPGFVYAQRALSRVCRQMGDWHNAVKALTALVAVEPDSLATRCNLALALERAGNTQEAMAQYEVALGIDPRSTRALAGKAGILEFTGRHDEARALLAPALDAGVRSPDVVIAFAKVSHRVGEGERGLLLVDEVLKQATTTREDRVYLCFGGGDICDALGRYDDAFRYYREGNELTHCAYDRAECETRVEQLMGVYSAERLPTLPRSGIRSEMPVFIVGMPRSGTSLVEQILATHPAVFGAGELVEIGQLAERLGREHEAGYPQCMTTITREALERHATPHLAMLRSLAPSARYVTDKMPHNFLSLGLIAQLFPGARVIHCVRNPVDTCLSCYFHNFLIPHSYAHDLGDLGHHYRQYLRLMAHWKAVLDISLLEIRYEDMVADQEGKTRELLAFLGLPWDDACLAFYKSSRQTRTASYDQVRKPIYTKSVERWRRYETHLGPLLAALGPAVSREDDTGGGGS